MQLRMPQRRRSTRQVQAQPDEDRPTKVERSVLVIAWRATASSPTGPDVRVLHPEHLFQLGTTEPWQAVIVRAVPSDERLWDFDTRYEMTTYPTELLWGPGPTDRAAAWYAGTMPQPDSVRCTRRIFVAQVVDSKKVFPPRSPAAAASVPEPLRSGSWYVVRAERPADVLDFARQLTAATSTGPVGPPVPRPSVEVELSGDWARVIDHLRRSLTPAEMAPAPDFYLPRRWSVNMATGEPLSSSR
ncbi:MAG: hypothetical protein ACP5PM_04420 [Acidimicrobiales bacterium]